MDQVLIWRRKKGFLRNGDNVSAGLAKGYGAFAGTSLNFDVIKSGQISGLKQGLNLELGGGGALTIKFEYGLQQSPVPYSLNIGIGVGLGGKIDFTTIGYQVNTP